MKILKIAGLIISIIAGVITIAYYPLVYSFIIWWPSGWIVSFFILIFLIWKLKNYYAKPLYKIPKETLKVVLKAKSSRWSNGKVKNKPAMFLHADFFITNITKQKIMVTDSFLSNSDIHASLPAVRHPSRDIYGMYPVFPGLTTELTVSFWIEPPIAKKEAVIKSVVIVDQFGNHHVVRNIKFMHIGK